ncbi:LysR family transcriptional regulator [Actinoplanes philippinensis]|uniref:LysR family transcriptional regulator n=1 Tax=Actinoplanes philippinensis TaxID=35752 RepID=UPI001940D51F|nr:LysR family transcriptional regulator [Actinoplanes philippinensis]GIE78607.1 LysR family transcriptional regulator [Actinoplanes philippinensis]
MHPQLLRAPRAVLDPGSPTVDSERLGFTRSALSKQIATLEAAAGVRLFERGPRGVDDLRPPLGGRVTLGGFPATALRPAPRAIARVRAAHCSIDVDFVESSTPVRIRRLRAGRLDPALQASGEGLPGWDLTGIEVEPLPSGVLLVAVGRRHRLAGAGRVPVTDLVGEGWIAGRGARGEPQFGVWPTLTEPLVAAELGDWSARFGFVAAGIGVTTVPRLVAGSVSSASRSTIRRGRDGRRVSPGSALSPAPPPRCVWR